MLNILLTKSEKMLLFKSTGTLTRESHKTHKAHTPFLCAKGTNTRNLCDCVMTTSLGSRNWGQTEVIEPLRLCDKSTTPNSEECGSRERRCW